MDYGDRIPPCYKLSQVIILSSKKSLIQSLFWNVIFPYPVFTHDDN